MIILFNAEFAMSNVTCEYDTMSSLNSGDGSSGRRVRRSEESLSQAAEFVRTGQTFQQVSDTFSIPISTIR